MLSTIGQGGLSSLEVSLPGSRRMLCYHFAEWPHCHEYPDTIRGEKGNSTLLN